MNNKRVFSAENLYKYKFLKIIIFFNLQCLGLITNGQTNFNDGLSVFCIGKELGKTDALYQFEERVNSWQKIAHLGTESIYSIAIDDDNFKLYAVNGGELGFINPVTAKFTIIGNIGSATGLSGTISINQVYGLAFEPIEKVLYATHRMQGQEDDILVKINPQTGKIITQQMQDENFNPVDYALIESSTRATVFPPPPLTETTSIAYDPITTELYCMQRSFDNIALCRINKLDGRLENVILDLSLTEMFAIASDVSNNLYSTNLYNLKEPSGLFTLNIDEGENVFMQYLQENKPEIEFTGIVFLKRVEKIEACKNEINLNIASPQSSVVEAENFIHSNATIEINTTYIAEDAVALYQYFTASENKNFCIEIKEGCP